MAAEIKLRAEEARNLAMKVDQEADHIRGHRQSLQSALSGLSSSFTGQAAAAFEAEYEQWRVRAEKLTNTLDALGEFLKNAATNIEELDQRMASQAQSIVE